MLQFLSSHGYTCNIFTCTCDAILLFDVAVRVKPKRCACTCTVKVLLYVYVYVFHEAIVSDTGSSWLYLQPSMSLNTKSCYIVSVKENLK